MGLVDSDQLLSPKRAHVALREREGALNPGNLCCAGFVCVFVFEWGQVKGIVDYVDINVYALEIPWGKVVPNADRFTYTRCGTPLLDAVMLCSARNWLEMLVEFVNFANREVFGLGCAVGRHEGDADRSSSTQIDLYCIA